MKRRTKVSPNLRFGKRQGYLKMILKPLSGVLLRKKSSDYRSVNQVFKINKCNDSRGHGRYTFKDQLRFCIIARGSLSETYNHFIDAFDCNYIDMDKLIELKKNIDEVERLLNGYISYLRKNM